MIRPGDPNAATPGQIIVRAAYDCRRGNSFEKWDPADFQLVSLALKCTGAHSIATKGNRMVFAIDGPAFEIPFGGFDERRDLRVDVRVQEAADEANA